MPLSCPAQMPENAAYLAGTPLAGGVTETFGSKAAEFDAAGTATAAGAGCGGAAGCVSGVDWQATSAIATKPSIDQSLFGGVNPNRTDDLLDAIHRAFLASCLVLPG
jgi:hypothetical protein